ncbi:glycosyltransferase family 4 protein [Enterococcus italicus]|uniref:glycosyltransferase family 4 protein n=1 Tax=Enterococcus italicus TaxID=246144 RepID=UPI002073D6AF|nr:glycosyltransferase family 4 protein [Enterococcus italicus]
MKKKVLFLHAGSELYGADKVLLDLVTGISNEFDCYVILPSTGPLYYEMKKKMINVSVMKYPILRRKYFNIKGMTSYFFNYLKFSHKISKYIKETKIDLVHVNTTAVLEGIYLKFFSRVKILWHVHEIITHPKIVYKFTSFLLNSADKVITVSEATKDHIVKSRMIKEEKIKVIYNGINNDIYNPKNRIEYLYDELSIPQKSKIVGMIGRVNSWKGQLDFIEAMEPILKKNEQTFAVLVGGVFEGEDKFLNDMKKRINESNQKDQFVISDFRSDIANVHNLFDIFVLPSTSPDPLPTVVLEAMATGKPIVGYNHGGITEMVEHKVNGLLSVPSNPQELSKNIDLILSDKQIQDEYGRNSFNRQIEKFSMQSYLSNFYKEYSDIIK